MRITFNMQADRYAQSISSGLNASMTAGERVARKQNLLTPEQNVTNYVSAYSIQRMIDDLTQFGANAKNANSWLTNSESQLEAAIKLLKTAKSELAVGGASSDKDAESRKALAGEVTNIFNSLMDIANANYMGRYMFGGFATNNPPFESASNIVKNIQSLTQNGGDVNTKSVYGDIPELPSGKYTAVVSVENGVGKLQILDSKGQPVIIDSNGSDESGGQGNKTATEMTFEYTPGMVINTGRGMSVKMPYSTATDAQVKLSYDYTAGSELNYKGDNGSIFSKVGYNQDIAMNVPGSSIFMQSFRTIQGSRFNTVNGLPANSTTYFNQLSNTNISKGDSIKVSGTDYNGRNVGSASVTTPTNPKLDLSKASEKERTLTVTYGDRLYNIVVPQASYKTTEELSNAINFQLKNAEYVGSLDGLPADSNIASYSGFVQGEVSSGKYGSETNPALRKNFLVDISGEINVGTDGGRLTFTTSKTGDNVRIAVTGQTQNSLGFDNKTIAAEGKDTVFETGYDFHKSTIQEIKTTYTKDLTVANGGEYNVFINGKLVSVKMPPITNATNISPSENINDPSGYVMNIKGHQINVPAAEIAATGGNIAAMTDLLNKKIADAGLGAEANIAGLALNGDGTYNYSLTTTDQSAKEIEMAFDKAMKSAGLGFGTTVSLKQGTPTPPATFAGVGVFDISFSSVNNNIDRNTELTTTFYDTTVAPPAGPIADVKSSAPLRTDEVYVKEKTLGDFLSFIKDLYGETVDASFDNGRLVVKDRRSGESKMSIDIRPQNNGIAHANDNLTVFKGTYTGTGNDNWTVNMTQTLNANGQRDVRVEVKNQLGNVIYDKVTDNYIGGGIRLPYGVTVDPYAIESLDPVTDPTKTISVNIALTAKSNLGFGDMNLVESGQNVNIFRSLTNLQHALEYNITKNGTSEPTAWKNTENKSTAKPFLAGNFQGSFNDNWTYAIQPNNGKNDFYIQNEYKTSTGDIKYDAAMANGPVSFNIDYYDNVTGKQERIPISIDLSLATPPLTTPKDTQEYIMKQLNNNPDLLKKDLYFAADGGKIQIQSGSGTTVANFTLSGDAEIRNRTSYIMGFEVQKNAPLTAPVTIDATNDTLFVGGSEIILTAGVYATEADMLTEINAQLTASGNGVTAAYGDKGELVFTKGTGIVEANSGGASNPLGLSMHSTTGGIDLFAKGLQKPTSDLSEASDDARTLKFTYTEAGVPPVQRNVSITLDKKAYTDIDDMVKDINDKLNLQFAGGISPIKANATSDGRFEFSNSDPNIDGFLVENDYAGTLGFPKSGDEASIRVESANGGTVQELTIKTAGKAENVSDGIFLGFDAGKLIATDSFKSAVGSGIEREIDVLNAAERQVLSAMAVVGNRGSRVESIVTFQETVIKTNERTKAGYLGSTEIDQANALTNYELSVTAYETALSVTGRIMSISILDFLR